MYDICAVNVALVFTHIFYRVASSLHFTSSRVSLRCAGLASIRWLVTVQACPEDFEYAQLKKLRS